MSHPTIHFILTVCVAMAARCSYGLSLDETAYFGTSGLEESNTGLVGEVTVTDKGEDWLIESNGIPDHETGTFPGKGNPNYITSQEFSFLVSKTPVVSDESTCLPMGPIAIGVNGVVMYSPWDSDGENAVEGDGAEVFDLCDGHPDAQGMYHYHQQPASCLFTITPGVPSPLIGVAFDGFPIYGPVDENGNTLTSSDLDECHGRYASDGGYQYHTTADFPYILGCYRGTPQGVRTNTDKCYKAENTDSGGNLIKTTTSTPTTTTTTAPTTTPTTTTAPTTTPTTITTTQQPATTTARACRRPNSRRCLNRSRRVAGAAARARYSKNILQRKLPAEFLENLKKSFSEE